MPAVIGAYLLAALPRQPLSVFGAHDYADTWGNSMIRDGVGSFRKHFLVFDEIELGVTYDFTLLFFLATDKSLIFIWEPPLGLNFGA